MAAVGEGEHCVVGKGEDEVGSRIRLRLVYEKNSIAVCLS